jgi:hypothetical protein
MADTVGKQRIRTDAVTDVQVAIYNAAGTQTAGVDAASNLQININAQGLAGVKTSRDGAAPTAANGNFAEVTTANAVLAVANPIPTRLSNGTAFNSVTAPAFVELTDGTNPLGTSTNPISVVASPGGSGTTVYRFNNATVTAGATTNVDYTVTALTTLTILKIVVSGPAAGNYALIIDPAGTNVTKIKLYTSPGSTVAEYVFARPLTVAAGLVVRIAKNNDDNQTAEMGFVWEGFEV